MPVHTGADKKGCYAQYGSSGKKYYYECRDKMARKQAKHKAHIQGAAIEASQKKRGEKVG